MDAEGRLAQTPWQMPWPAWKTVAIRSWNEASDDNIGLVAAGVAFYGFLAIIPLLGAVVLLAIGYHHACAVLLRKLRAGASRHSHRWFRWFNEMPVLFLVAAVVLALALVLLQWWPKLHATWVF